MKNIINEDLIRQIEFAGLVLEKPGYYTELDILDYFKVSPQTVRRDTERLRSMGVNIHSTKKKYHIFGCSLLILNQLICTYLALNKYDNIKNLNLIQKKFRGKTLMIFVRILKAISNRNKLIITYDKSSNTQGEKKEITPISIMRSGRSLYMIAMEDDDVKKVYMFLLNKIQDIEFQNEKSRVKTFPDISNIFKTTWGTFSGGEECEVILKFNKFLGEGVKNRFYIETQEITEEEDCIMLRMKVKLSYEFISWVMGWGDGAEVIEPKKLRDAVFSKAMAIVLKYEDKKL